MKGRKETYKEGKNTEGRKEGQKAGRQAGRQAGKANIRRTKVSSSWAKTRIPFEQGVDLALGITTRVHVVIVHNIDLVPWKTQCRKRCRKSRRHFPVQNIQSVGIFQYNIFSQ
jgi:hypothetical protein